METKELVTTEEKVSIGTYVATYIAIITWLIGLYTVCYSIAYGAGKVGWWLCEKWSEVRAELKRWRERIRIYDVNHDIK